MAQTAGFLLARVTRMALPELIEIVPVEKPVHFHVTVPGSKSITNRALILAALTDNAVTLRGALWSEDTQITVEALQTLGFRLEVQPDRDEIGNRTIKVHGLGGKIPNAGTASELLEIFVGNAGTAARFLAALVCLGQGVYRLHGVPRMHERPQAALFSALRQLGYQVDAPNDRLPAVIQGSGPRPGKCEVGIEESSQFASALILCSQRAGWQVEVTGHNAEESAYVKMTSQMVKTFPGKGGTFQIEPDASSGSYFWAAASLLGLLKPDNDAEEPPPLDPVNNWPSPELQVDALFPAYLSSRYRYLLPPHSQRAQQLPRGKQTISRATDLGDSIMTAIVIAPFRQGVSRFIDLGRLRLQECERVVALRTELTKCGAKVGESGDTLEVCSSALLGAEIETYNDHRMAMCFAILALKIPGMRIRNPACVKKTFPDFFQKLATAAPEGVGAAILDAKSRRELRLEELFAD
jgi:3-phosphoshikimate 1-carboxyvinyltransferase